MSRYRSSSAYNQLLIAHIMSKILFMQYLPPVRSKIKNAQNLSKFGTSNISSMLISILMSKMIFMKCLPPVLVPNLKMLRIYWDLAHSVFQICQSRFWCQKCFFYQIFTNCQAQIGPKIKNSQNLLKFSQIDISDFDFKVKKCFTKYLPN